MPVCGRLGHWAQSGCRTSGSLASHVSHEVVLTALPVEPSPEGLPHKSSSSPTRKARWGMRLMVEVRQAWERTRLLLLELKLKEQVLLLTQLLLLLQQLFLLLDKLLKRQLPEVARHLLVRRVLQRQLHGRQLRLHSLQLRLRDVDFLHEL